VKKFSSPLFLSISFLFLLAACKKINEPTDLGGDLIPPVDNVNTFESSFEVQSDLLRFNDSTRFTIADDGVFGEINDPAFGNTKADLFFKVSSLVYGSYPFNSKRDSVLIDSVILSLDVSDIYGDTTIQQTVGVYEVDDPTFSDTTVYKYSQNFTASAQLGSKTFDIKTLNDSVIAKPTGKLRDSAKVANVLRIPLSISFGQRLASYDTAANSPNPPGFRSDSLFKTLFKGFAIRTTSASGRGALIYSSLANTEKTRLLVYYRGQKDGVKDTNVVAFTHQVSAFSARIGQANYIRRNEGGGYLSALNNVTDTTEQLLHIQSTPGSYAKIWIKALDTFSNKVIHRAELITYRIADPDATFFTPPLRLFLDKIRNDTAFILANDMVIENGAINFNLFGGNLRTDNTYRFNITRHVQGIVTRKEPNTALRIYAPLDTRPYNPNNQQLLLQIIDRAAKGRVIVTGGEHPDPNFRMRLRIIYSNL
jgi:hypothetical protein